jgi:hypothetical protein
MLEFGSAPASWLAPALAILGVEQRAASLASQRPSAWQGAVGPVRLRLVLPAFGAPAVQPLLPVGDPGTGGLLFVRREDRGHVRLGFRQRGEDPLLSDSLAVDPAAVQEIDLSLGSLLPPDDGVIYREDANFGALRTLLYVRLNGRMALKARRNFVPVLRRVAFGLNLVDASTSELYFQGSLVSLAPLAAAEFPALLHLTDIVPGGPGWQGFPGPIRLRVVLPLAGVWQEPLLVTGVTGAADFIYVRYLDDRHVQVGYDHWGGGGAVSPPIVVQPGQPQDFVISLGSLLPPAGDAIYARDPRLNRLRQVLFVSLNGQTVLDAPLLSNPSRLDQLILGSNPVGGSTAAPSFKGRILGVERVSPAQIAEALAVHP